VLDYTAVFTLIGFLALMFIPLYIPIAVTIVGAFRHRRQKSDQQIVRRPATRAAEVAQRRPLVPVITPSTAAAPRSNQGALSGAERPVAEAV
jgi:ABC-type spermidine/putrescine transport system permease subunit II